MRLLHEWLYRTIDRGWDMRACACESVRKGLIFDMLNLLQIDKSPIAFSDDQTKMMISEWKCARARPKAKDRGITKMAKKKFNAHKIWRKKSIFIYKMIIQMEWIKNMDCDFWIPWNVCAWFYDDPQKKKKKSKKKIVSIYFITFLNQKFGIYG